MFVVSDAPCRNMPYVSNISKFSLMLHVCDIVFQMLHLVENDRIIMIQLTLVCLRSGIHECSRIQKSCFDQYLPSTSRYITNKGFLGHLHDIVSRYITKLICLGHSMYVLQCITKISFLGYCVNYIMNNASGQTTALIYINPYFPFYIP